MQSGGTGMLAETYGDHLDQPALMFRAEIGMWLDTVAHDDVVGLVVGVVGVVVPDRRPVLGERQMIRGLGGRLLASAVVIKPDADGVPEALSPLGAAGAEAVPGAVTAEGVLFAHRGYAGDDLALR